MYSLERSEKSTGAGTQVLLRPWRSFDAGAGDALEHAVDVAVGEQLALEAGASRRRRAPARGRRPTSGRRSEELAAVGGHGQRRMVRALVDQPEERQHPRPGVPRAGQAVAAARRRPSRVPRAGR